MTNRCTHFRTVLCDTLRAREQCAAAGDPGTENGASAWRMWVATDLVATVRFCRASWSAERVGSTHFNERTHHGQGGRALRATGGSRRLRALLRGHSHRAGHLDPRPPAI